MPSTPLTQIVNARILGREGLWDVAIANQTFAAIVPSLNSQGAATENTLDAKGKLLCPPLCEPHVHLDTTLTAGEPEWNRSGTLFEGVQRWAQRKESLSFEDVTTRARKAISWYVANGVQFIRTHCDVTDPKLTALHALLELKQELRELVTLQIVAFPKKAFVPTRKAPNLPKKRCVWWRKIRN